MTTLTMIQKMATGLGRTFAIFFLTLAFSLPLGVILALLRRSKVGVLRGTPLMLQLLAVTYGPYYISKFLESQFGLALGIGVARNKLVPIIAGFAINYAAYFAEIYRGGIESMSQGQYEAAEVLGYSRTQTFMRIILPQVVKRILPSITNEVITLVKDTSMAFTVGYQEMFTIGKTISNSESSFMPFLIAGVFYFLFNGIVDFVMTRLERKLNYYR